MFFDKMLNYINISRFKKDSDLKLIIPDNFIPSAIALLDYYLKRCQSLMAL